MSLRAAVLGHPISHSKSPALHPAAYAKLGIDISYTAVDLTEQHAAGLYAGVRTQEGWRGLSVTMPLKTAMVQKWTKSAESRTSWAWSTLWLSKKPVDVVRRVAYNTDVAGIVNAVRNAGAARSPLRYPRRRRNRSRRRGSPQDLGAAGPAVRP